MKLKEIRQVLEEIAPPSLQESYDNSGLIVGDDNLEVTKALICLDSTEAVVDEAIAKGCNLIVAHHPIVFKGLKRFNGGNYVERVVMKAIKKDIAIYAIHTNLDNVLDSGVNSKIAERLGLTNTRVLSPKSSLIRKLVVFVPNDHAEAVRNAIGEAGAGKIGDYDHCSFQSIGEGRFRANDSADPFVGKANELHMEPEVKVEAVFPEHLKGKVLAAMLDVHPYEEPAYDVLITENIDPKLGSGLMGTLDKEMSLNDFLKHLKTSMNTEVIRYTNAGDKPVKTVALCGGSGSFLLSAAKRAGADAFVTGDFKYHDFFDGEDQVHICDIGHYESEQFTIDLLGEIINKKFPNFAVIFAESVSNPVNYFY